MSTRVQIPQMPAAAPARTVTPAPFGTLQRKCACGGSGGPGGECEGCKKKKQLQRSAAGSGPETAPPIVHEVLRSPGQPLDTATRSFFEPRFGHDFSKVRIHTDAKAAASSRSVGAAAYTVGPHIVFADRLPSIQSEGAARLMAHELAHVLQQPERTHGSAGLAIGEANSPFEREADCVSEAVLRSWPAARPMQLGKPSVQRQPLPAPNRAPTCDELCPGNACVQGPGEQCTGTPDNNTVFAAWAQAAKNLAAAISAFDDGASVPPASPAAGAKLSTALKTNFSWSPGNSPANLPATVRSTLGAGYTKFSDYMCHRCKACDAAGLTVAMIARDRDGKNCLTQGNCFFVCPAFTASNGPHAMTHELFHRVVTLGQSGDLYRGQPGYPGPPTYALKLPDAYASLVDDLAPPAPTTPTPPAPPQPAPPHSGP